MKVINSFLGKFNYKIEKKYSNKIKSEGYPDYLETATNLNMDVNDYLDSKLGWIKPKPVLEEVFYPVLETISKPVLLELGPGTGRWTRYILEKAKQLKSNEYYLIDHASWMLDFLDTYFKKEPIVRIFKNDGMTIPVENSVIDIVFTQGVFIELKPASIYLYAKEFSRILKPGGYCVLDYFNCDSEEGWNFFVNQSNQGNIFSTYYPDEFINKVFKTTGFELEKRYIYGKSNFVVFKKLN